MSTKFFTWTKGDRRQAVEALRSGGVVPIPIECITIKGMDYARRERGIANRRPKALTIDGSTVPTPNHSSRTNDSLALQDAAVQSATSLMNAMNDMLRSPPLSTHLFPHGPSADHVPLHYRARSHTAPPTPVVEAPSTQPVELPGSFPDDRKAFLPYHRPINGANDILLQSPEQIPRPHSSPQEATHANRSRSRMSVESFYRDSTHPPPSQPSPLKSRDPTPKLNDSSFSYGRETLVAQDTNPVARFIKRPSLAVLPNAAPGSSGLSTGPSNAGSVHQITTLDPSQHDNDLFQYDLSHQVDAEALLIQQILNMRASHEAYLGSLKDAHEKEVSTHQSYINFLERRHGSLQSAMLQISKHIPAGDTLYSARTGSDASTETLQSIESSIEMQRQKSHEAAGAEALKRKLSLFRKTELEAVGLRRDRDHLREAADRSHHRILQLKDIVRHSKENEKALKNSNLNLEERLIASNNERTDVLEGYHDACGKIRWLSERERVLSEELEDVRSRVPYSEASSKEQVQVVRRDGGQTRHTRTVSDVGWMSGKDDPLLQELRSLRRLVSEKDVQIQRLEHTVSTSRIDTPSCPTDQCPLHSARITELESMLDSQKQSLTVAQADCDRYNSLLHAELRRQARSGAEKAHIATPNTDAELTHIATEKADRLKARTEALASSDLEEKTTADAQSLPPASVLEKELEHCIKEIIMYKMDVRGYRRDLKKANAKLETLQAIPMRVPPTPEHSSKSSGTSQLSADKLGAEHNVTVEQQTKTPEVQQSGLGIVVQHPERQPVESVASATLAALEFETPPARSLTMSTPPAPPSRSKTPLNTHKRLPKPPSSPEPSLSLTPSNIDKVQRSETLRSFSESVISIGSKQTMSSQGPSWTPPKKHRISESRSLGSPLVPLSKFAPQQSTALTDA